MTDQNERPTDPEQRDGSGRQNNMPPAPLMSRILLFLTLSLLVLVLVSLFVNRAGQTAVDYSVFMDQIEKKNVESVTISGLQITGKFRVAPDNPAYETDKKQPQKLSQEFRTDFPLIEDRTLLNRLEGAKQQDGVKLTVKTPEKGFATEAFIYLLPAFLLIGFMVYMMRRTADPMGSGMLGGFIRSPAKRFRPNEQKTTFDDVAGMEQAKRELTEVVEFLKDPAKFQRLGAQIPKGVLLNGPPGTGKTLLARACAGEAGVPFFSINGSEFIQMFVGVGASRVRDLFRTAKEAAPAIIFVDEIDAVGRVRGAGLGGGHDEREQTLNQILSEMDGFQATEAVIVIAATNRPDVLDPALLRPGRFDRHVTVDRPTKKGREAILKVHSRKVPLATDVRLDIVAAGTIGFAGADLKNLVNEAALHATREGKSAVDMADFEAAQDKIMMGVIREEVLTPHERRMTAYHEAGHALLAWVLPDVDCVHKVTIVPRGRALGVTQFLPQDERLSMGERQLRSQLSVFLGGRAAEKIVFDEYTAGAESDIHRATAIARRMIAAWGMSEVVGPAAFRDGEEHPFLGKEIHEHRQFSEATAHVIDQEIQKFLVDAQNRAVQLLTENRDKLDKLSEALLDKELLDSEEIAAVIGPAVPRTSAVVPNKTGDV